MHVSTYRGSSRAFKQICQKIQSQVHPEAIHTALETDTLLHPSLCPGLPNICSLSRLCVAALRRTDQYPCNRVCLQLPQIVKAFLYHVSPMHVIKHLWESL